MQTSCPMETSSQPARIISSVFGHPHLSGQLLRISLKPTTPHFLLTQLQVGLGSITASVQLLLQKVLSSLVPQDPISLPGQVP